MVVGSRTASGIISRWDPRPRKPGASNVHARFAVLGRQALGRLRSPELQTLFLRPAPRELDKRNQLDRPC